MEMARTRTHISEYPKSAPAVPISTMSPAPSQVSTTINPGPNERRYSMKVRGRRSCESTSWLREQFKNRLARANDKWAIKMISQLRPRRQQQRQQDPNNGDYDQKFDKGKTMADAGPAE